MQIAQRVPPNAIVVSQAGDVNDIEGVGRSVLNRLPEAPLIQCEYRVLCDGDGQTDNA
jgi:hypothetical protein